MKSACLVILWHTKVLMRFEVWFSLCRKSNSSEKGTHWKQKISNKVNRFAGININNRSGLMGFRGVNLGIMMSGQALWWERKLNCRRESGSQDYATVSVAMARVYPVVPRVWLSCNWIFHFRTGGIPSESAHFVLGQLVETEPYVCTILQMIWWVSLCNVFLL